MCDERASCVRHGLISDSEHIPAIRRGDIDFDDKLATLLELARQATANKGSVKDADWQTALDAGWSDTELTELSTHVALNLFTNYFNHLVDTDLDIPAAPSL
ncbi:carboxymuconolactone decarboxylase family protein [Arthrobacter sp. TB 23]|uniref:carboxymuconolactone decarboxylase family protein n=1 Tax=Arthrobacter sp. TB 23 TaxID=494419 RepID=UPI0003787BE1|nr:hypothetical protein [Arthrobacter sp. TB 23]